MKSRWERGNDQQFFYADYSNFQRDVDALRAEVDEVDAVIIAQPEHSVRVLVDLRDTVTSSEVVSMLKASAARTETHVRKHAVVGIVGIQRVLAPSVAGFSGEPLHLFDDVEVAREWLTSDRDAGR